MTDQQITIPQAEYEALQHYKRVYSEVSRILACLADCESPKDGDEITVQRLKWVVREYPELAATSKAPAHPSVPAPWREAVKVAREALQAVLEDTGIAEDDWNRAAFGKGYAALAQLDALEGGE